MARSGKVRVLVVDDDQSRGLKFQRCLSEEFEISLAASQEAAQKILDSQEFDVLIGANDVSQRPHSGVNGAEMNGAPVNGAAVNGAGVNGANLRNGAALVSHVESGQGIGASKDNSVLAKVVADVIASGRSLDVAMAEIEAAVIRAALKQQRGNRSAAARQLQLPRQTLQDRMKKHGLWSS